MKMNLTDARTHFCQVVRDLLDGKEDRIIIYKNG